MIKHLRKIYVQALGFLTRAEGLRSVYLPDEEEIEYIDAPRKIVELPDYLGNHINILI